MTTPIPHPPSIPFIGNITALDNDVPLHSYVLLAKQYGEIYQLDLLGKTILHLNTYALVNEVSDEKRFKKYPNPPLLQVRNLLGDGLFTAQNDEPNWAIAHRLLMPAFGPLAVKGMMEGMRDISDQLLLKWERFGPDHVIDPSDDFTRTALDAIAFCSMSYRLNSFYTETQPEFARAMVDFLKECFARAKRPYVVQALMPSASAKYEGDQKLMRDLADRIVAHRKEHPSDKKDLLDIMVNGKDPKTGQGLPDANIAQNLLTFLIAGHETSSGMMTFMIYYLLKNPEAMRKLRAEIDEVLGGRPVQCEDFSKLPYLTAVMRETLRLCPTAPLRGVCPLEDTAIGGGKYNVKAGTTMLAQIWIMHRDPLVWGEDAEEFKPERMLGGKFEALPPNAWQPFGFGLRGCIGRAFAWQEVSLVITSVVQKFDLSLVDPSYTLEIKQALTVKPKDLLIRAAPRGQIHLYATPSSSLMQARGDSDSARALPKTESGRTPLYILYGSNTGTSEAFAQRLTSDAPSYGFSPKIGTMDSSVGHLPTDGPVIILTASFEGEPPDNAGRFIDWLKSFQEKEAEKVSFAVWGSGNSDWVNTFQKIPKLCDNLLEEHGGRRLVPRGVGDAGQGNFFEVFDEFEANLWAILSKEYSKLRSSSASSGFEVKVLDAGTERPGILRQPDAALGRVIENRVITQGGPVKRHIEFELPGEMTFRAGDYLAVFVLSAYCNWQVPEGQFDSLPHNPPRDVQRVLALFGFSSEQEIIISSDGPTSLPTGKGIKLLEILSGYVELSQPATTRDLGALIEAATGDSTRRILQDLKAAHSEKVLAKKLSIVDILEAHSDVKLPLNALLRMLPPMRVRQYSISSSPLWNPRHVTLTLSVIEAPSIAGHVVPFLGVASNFLGHLLPGDRVQMAVRPSAAAFHLPENPMIPVVMFCSGSGLAPMRGFIQERAAQKMAGREVAPMLLFFGCRSPEKDYLYGDSDLAEWAKLGVVDIRPAFSRSMEHSGGCKYVQDRIWQDRADVVNAFKNNAKLFTCGSRSVAKGIKAKLIEIIQNLDDIDLTAATAKFEKITANRYATDIFD